MIVNSLPRYDGYKEEEYLAKLKSAITSARHISHDGSYSDWQREMDAKLEYLKSQKAIYLGNNEFFKLSDMSEYILNEIYRIFCVGYQGRFIEQTWGFNKQLGIEIGVILAKSGKIVKMN